MKQPFFKTIMCIKRIYSLESSWAILVLSRSAAESLPGLQVGEKTPPVSLQNSAGEIVLLSQLFESGPVALVFVRSADWCPHCRRQLVELEAGREAVESTGGRIVAVSYDAPATNAAAVAKLKLTYPLLSDEGSRAIDAFGIRNHEAKGKGAGIPHPTIFVVDRTGTIRAKLARENYRERPESAEIAAAFEAL